MSDTTGEKSPTKIIRKMRAVVSFDVMVSTTEDMPVPYTDVAGYIKDVFELFDTSSPGKTIQVDGGKLNSLVGCDQSIERVIQSIEMEKTKYNEAIYRADMFSNPADVVIKMMNRIDVCEFAIELLKNKRLADEDEEEEDYPYDPVGECDV